MKNKLPWLILLAIHIAFFYYALNGGQTQLKDSTEYLQQAENIRTRHTWYCGNRLSTFKEELVSQRPPLYGLFISFTQIFSMPVPLLFFLQMLLSILNCWIAYHLLIIITNKKINPGLFLFPLIFFPTQFIYANMIMSEVLFQTFLMAAIYFGIVYLQKDKISFLWKFQLLITLSFLVKPIALLFPILLFPLHVIYCIKTKKNKTSLVTFLIPFLTLVGMMQFNYSKTGVWEYSSISRKLMLNYNIYALSEKINGPVAAYQEIDSIETIAATLPYPQRAVLIDKFCSEKIAEHPIRYSVLHIYGAWRFFIDPCTWETNHFFNTTQNSLSNKLSTAIPKTGMDYLTNEKLYSKLFTLLSIFVNCILLLTFVLSLSYKNIALKFRILLGAFILYFAFLTGPSASSRFRLPIYPLLLVSFGLFVNKVEEVSNEHLPSRD